MVRLALNVISVCVSCVLTIALVPSVALAQDGLNDELV